MTDCYLHVSLIRQVAWTLRVLPIPLCCGLCNQARLVRFSGTTIQSSLVNVSADAARDRVAPCPWHPFSTGEAFNYFWPPKIEK
ncbi:Uncharacterized protein TCM_029903 [Theobroma cacao]|uniref:Uncharacterized protein n=1 Tax=Theobroma cacao TaxID=3641 RepID=A0A061GFF4_THECC|nr:Uncharacterized protein TCM_029903 [Theobroma cacao]